MKNVRKLGSFLMAVVMVISMTSFSTFAATNYNTREKANGIIDGIYSAIDNQNFKNSNTTAKAVKEKIRYFIYDSKYSAVSTTKFPHKNGGAAVNSVSDGTYTVKVDKAKGCYAYADFVSGVVYGKISSSDLCLPKKDRRFKNADALKIFLQSEAQAGEHIRIRDNHSIVFVADAGRGFYALDYAGDDTQKIRLRYRTYTEFFESFGSNDIWIYNVNTSKNNYETETLTPPTTPVNKDMIVNVGSGWTLRLCDAPSDTNNRLASIPDKATVRAIEKTTKAIDGKIWAKVKYGNTEGWVNWAYLKEKENQPPVADNVTLTYDAMGGSETPSAQTVKKGSSATVSSTKPTKKDYTFMGWSTSSSAGRTVNYVSGNSITLNSNVTLYAVWQQNVAEYTISYDSNDKGNQGINGFVTDTVKSGAAYTINYGIPIWEGYTFLGWSESKTATRPTYYSGDRITVTKNMQLYAVWQKNAIKDWTEWSTNTPPRNAYQVEQKTQYRFRDQTLGSWGNYSSWSTSYPGASNDTMQVEQRQIKSYNMSWYRYQRDASPHERSYRSAYVKPGTSGTRESYGYYSNTTKRPITQEELDNATQIRAGGWLGSGVTGYNDSDKTGYYFGGSLGDSLWFIDSTNTDTEYRYRTRTSSAGSWSSWSDTPVSSTSTREVETQILYRYIPA